MEKKFFYAQVPPLRCGKDLDNRWKYEIPAYRVAPHVWNVGGQDDVCAYLLDSGEGLILIDTAMSRLSICSSTACGASALIRKISK